MIDKLQQIIQQVTNQEVGDNVNISKELAGNVAQETGSTLMDGLKSAVSNGNIGELTSIFSGSGEQSSITSNPLVQNIVSSLTSKLGSNVGLDSSTAGGFASAIIPKLISVITDKVKSGDIDVTALLSSFTSGNSILDQNGDGKVGIDDAISAVKKGNIGDMLGGFFK